jgi:hypothetical protein
MDERENGLISVAEAAEAIGVPYGRVYYLMQTIDPPLARVGTRYVLTSGDLARLRAAHKDRPGNRPHHYRRLEDIERRLTVVESRLQGR